MKNFIISLMIVSCPLSAWSQGKKFKSVAEASAIVMTNDGFLIAGDEHGTGLWHYSFAGEIKEIPFNSPNSEPIMDDAEGLAPYGNKFLLVTSLSLTKNGKLKPKRDQLMAFSRSRHSVMVEKSIPLRALVIEHLRQSLTPEQIDKDILANATPDNGGLNVEGLAYQCGKIYLGIREPLTKNGEAIIVPIEWTQDKLTFDAPILVQANGLGIRGLSEGANCDLIIVTGAVDGAPVKKYQLGLLRMAEFSVLNVSGFEKLTNPEGVSTYGSKKLIFTQDLRPESKSDPIVILESSQWRHQ